MPLIYHGDEAVELHQRILERRRSEQDLRHIAECGLERAPDLVVRSVHVAQAVRLVDYDKIPWRDHQLIGITRRKLERADHNGGLFKGPPPAILDAQQWFSYNFIALAANDLKIVRDLVFDRGRFLVR